jgi:3-deoxy-D-manno-octulosonic-acid transferase
LFILLYSFLLTLGLLLTSPWWLWLMLATGRHSEGLSERLGLVPSRIRAAAAGKQVVWVHAVSVGELLAAERLIHELEDALGAAPEPAWVVALSTTTAAGQQLARERFPANPVFFFPLDFAFAVRPWLRALRPRLMILVESEFWPRHLVECARSRIPVAVVNARISDRSFPRYLRLRALWRPILANVSLFLAQGEETAGRLRQIGAPPSRIQVPGNLKYDARIAGINAITERLRPLLRNRRVIVAGSTLRGEETTILKAFYYVRNAMPGVRDQELNSILILAPRHPQRFAEVEGLIQNSLERGDKKPLLLASQLGEREQEIQPGTIILLDTLGDLSSVYQLAHAAFIGGSLLDAGGHNPLEPARFAVPILMGPSYGNFREIVEDMIEQDAIRIVEGDHLALAAALLQLLHDDQGLGPRARAFFETRAGATTGTVAALLELLDV